jgi:hypothetical protein
MSKLRIIDGDGMSADDAAWLSIAEEAERVVMRPGLSQVGVCEMELLREACLRAAGLPPSQRRLGSRSAG